jgi:Fe-S-cluster containining protein
MHDLAEIVRAAAGRDDVVSAIRAVYDRLADRVARRRPLCIASGRCCRFEEFGHRLYVTTIELAAFFAELPGHVEGNRLAARFGEWDGTGCPFQVQRMCGVHAIKPMGCRLFFCDASSTQWQQEEYERFHVEIKLLHETLDVPYRYLEWRAGLRALFGTIE